MEQFTNRIAGRPVEASEWIDSTSPATGNVWARVPAGTAADIDAAVVAAVAAQREWMRLTAAERARRLRGWADSISAHAVELATIESRDNGRVIGETLHGDLPRASEVVRYHAELIDKTVGATIPVDDNALTYTAYEPLGVVGIILPYNAPLSLFFNKVSAALAAGNAVVVKPPEQAPCSVLRAAELLDQLDLPVGLVSVVAGYGAVAGDALAGHPDVAMIHFTGSTATGVRISQRAAGTIKKVALELGGKSPNIVFADADLDLAAAGVVAGVFTGGAGQSCLAGTRLLVEAAVRDPLVARIHALAAGLVIGDPLDPATDMGPISFRGQFDKVRSYLDPDAVVFGGRTGEQLFPDGSPLRSGFFVEPTLLTARDARAVSDEIFGPVAVVIPFDDDDEAVRLANDTRYGLVAGIWTESLRRAHRMVRDLQAGTVWVNTYRRLQHQIPFGGHKESGNGSANGLDALREWSNVKAVWLQTGRG